MKSVWVICLFLLYCSTPVSAELATDVNAETSNRTGDVQAPASSGQAIDIPKNGDSSNLKDVAALSIAALALIVSIISLVLGVSERNRDRKRNMCMQMYLYWNRKETQESRAKVWEYLSKIVPAEKESWKNIQASDLSSHFEIIDHFVSDLVTLLSNKMIDRSLSKEFFYETLAAYMRKFEESINYDTEPGAAFFKKRMKPVMTLL